MLRLLELLFLCFSLIVLVSQIIVPLWDASPIFPSLRRKPKREEEENTPSKLDQKKVNKPNIKTKYE